MNKNLYIKFRNSSSSSSSSSKKPLPMAVTEKQNMPFAHGHLYVASFRVRSADNIAYFFEDGNENVKLHKKPIVTNIVYKSLILN